MKPYEELLQTRTHELEDHLKLITQLNEAAVTGKGIPGHPPIEKDQVEILKSGFLVHLYNFVEAMMDVILNEVANATAPHPPRLWTRLVRAEWVRARAGVERDLDSNQRLSRTLSVLDETIEDTTGVDYPVVTSSGNWSDREIKRVSDRLGCTLQIAPNVHSSACNNPFQDDLAPMKYVRHKRNRLAHGSEDFLSGADLLSPSDLDRLRVPVVDFMESVAGSYTQFLDSEAFLSATT